MTYSGEYPAVVSPECYKDIEISLEQFYNSENNPFRNIFINTKRMSQKDVTEKFDLVITDYGKDDDGFIVVELQSKENSEYKPFREVFDKTYGEVA